MKKYLLVILLMVASFAMGYFYVKISGSSDESNEKKTLDIVNYKYMKKVTGIGGVFFKCKDRKSLMDWYSRNLGLNTDEYGTSFVWHQGEDSTKKGFTQWSPFSEETEYFLPSEKEFMINFRVHNIEKLVEELKSNGVKVTDSIETYDYGKFVHIMDLEGNKIELWEPNDDGYDSIAVARTM